MLLKNQLKKIEEINNVISNDQAELPVMNENNKKRDNSNRKDYKKIEENR